MTTPGAISSLPAPIAAILPSVNRDCSLLQHALSGREASQISSIVIQ